MSDEITSDDDVGESGRFKRTGLPQIVVLAVLVCIVLAIYVPNLTRSRIDSPPPTACRSNLRNIATALEEYANENHGHFPPSLQSLVPRYLKAIPSCPSVGSVTYTQGYEATTEDFNRFTVICIGNNHERSGYSPNYPQYSSTQGLLVR